MRTKRLSRREPDFLAFFENRDNLIAFEGWTRSQIYNRDGVVTPGVAVSHCVREQRGPPLRSRIWFGCRTHQSLIPFARVLFDIISPTAGSPINTTTGPKISDSKPVYYELRTVFIFLLFIIICYLSLFGTSFCPRFCSGVRSYVIHASQSAD